MNINKHTVMKRIHDIKRDISTVMSAVEHYDNNNDTVWCAQVIKNIAYLITLSSVFLTNLEIEKDGLMAVLQKHMEDNGIEKEESAELKISIRKNPPRLIINDDESIDKGYYYEETQTKLDKKLITEHIKKGLEVTGCKLIQDQRVEIKYKSVNSKEHV